MRKIPSKENNPLDLPFLHQTQCNQDLIFHRTDVTENGCILPLLHAFLYDLNHPCKERVRNSFDQKRNAVGLTAL